MVYKRAEGLPQYIMESIKEEGKSVPSEYCGSSKELTTFELWALSGK